MTRVLPQNADDVTVAVCTYNNAHLLNRALDALERQQVSAAVKWSVIIVDNNCTDDTADVVARYVARDYIPGLRLAHEPRQGLAHARRRAIAESRGDVIAFVDDDCVLAPSWLDAAARFMADHPRAGAAGGRVRLVWETQPSPVLLQYAQRYAQQDCGDLPCQTTPNGPVCPAGAGLVVRRDAIHACRWIEQGILVGRSGKKLSSGEDTELVCRIRNAGFEVWYDPDMELSHYIAEHRATVPYLCRLMRGNGQIEPLLTMLQENRPPTLRFRLRQLGQSASSLSLLLLAAMWHDWLHFHRTSPEHRVELACRLGRIEGAVRFLRYRG